MSHLPEMCHQPSPGADLGLLPSVTLAATACLSPFLGPCLIDKPVRQPAALAWPQRALRKAWLAAADLQGVVS